MSAISVNPPYPIFTDTDGQPLENGYIWIGIANLAPMGNPVNVYWDAALIVPAPQPIRTSGGYPVRNGSPTRVYTSSDYSILVQNKNGSTVYSSPVSTDFTSAVDVSFQPAGTGATARTVQSKLRDTVSVKDFGAVGDGVTDDTAAIQAAANYCNTNSCELNLVSGGTYYCASLVATNCDVSGHGATIRGQLTVTASNVTIKDLNIVSPLAVYGVYLTGQLASRISNVQLLNVGISFSGGTPALRLGISARYIDDLVIDNCRIDYGANLIRCFNYRFTNNILNGYYQNENELLHATVRSYGIISSNTFLDSFDNWIDLYSSGERTVVQGNRFIGCYARLGTGIEIKVTLTDDPNNTSGGPNDYGFTEHIVFSDNYIGGYAPSIVASSSLLNIYYLDSRAAPSFSWADVPRNIVISNNIFDGTDTTSAGGASVNAISLYKLEGVVVEGNTFRDLSVGGTASNNSACVWIEGCQYITVSNNIMGIRDGTGVLIQDTCSNLNITGNQIIEDLGTGNTPAFGIHMTKIGSRPVVSLTNSIISNNRIVASLACIRCLNNTGSVADLVISGNLCDNETVLDVADRCTITSNQFGVRSARFKAFSLGYAGAVAAKYNIVTNNTIQSPSGSPKNGIELTRCRSTIVSNNIIHTANNGMFVIGTNTAGELDFLTIKDNYSVSQASAAVFPFYSNMNAADTATLVVANNQKIT